MGTIIIKDGKTEIISEHLVAQPLTKHRFWLKSISNISDATFLNIRQNITTLRIEENSNNDSKVVLVIEQSMYGAKHFQEFVNLLKSSKVTIELNQLNGDEEITNSIVLNQCSFHQTKFNLSYYGFKNDGTDSYVNYENYHQVCAWHLTINCQSIDWS